jgi:hypothetical protein
MSGQPDGGRLTGRVLAYLLIPPERKKFREKSKKVTESLWKGEIRDGAEFTCLTL